MRSSFVFLFLISISSVAWSVKNTNCPEAAKVKEFDISKEMGPIRDQDGEGWCNAYGVSDQLTYWMAKRKTPGVTIKGGGRVSPVAMALDLTAPRRREAYNKYLAQLKKYNEQIKKGNNVKRPSFEFPIGATLRDTFRSAFKEGVCQESYVASDGFDAALGNNIHKILAQYPFSNCSTCKAEQSIQAVFPHYNGNILDVLKKIDTLDPYSEFIKSCKRLTIPEPRPYAVDVLINTISEALEKNAEPIGLSFKPDFLNFSDDKIAATYGTGGEKTNPINLHYALLVGKRFNCATKEEDLIIRNSWGPDQCQLDREQYRSKEKSDATAVAIEVNSKKCRSACRESRVSACRESCIDAANQKRIELHKPPFECENGHYIIPKSLLMGALRNAIQLQPPK